MKNILLILTTSVLLLTNSLAFGQDQTNFPDFAGPQQMELLPPEMAHLFNQMMEEANLYFNEALTLGMTNNGPSDSSQYTVDVMIEVVMINEYTPTPWEESIFSTTAYNTTYPIVDNNDLLLAFFDPLNYTSSQYALMEINNKELSTMATCPSMLCLGTSAIRWFDLDDEGWNPDESPKPSIKVSSIGEWHFNIGPDEDSRYFIPILD